MVNKCKECGCMCKQCIPNDHDVHLHVEIENLKQKLVERENHIVTMETNFLNEANKFPSGELVALREELLMWQDKYRRLYDAHRRVQRVNQGLEDKLLKLVDVCETDKSTLTKDVAVLSQKLAEANYAIKKLTEDNGKYKSDVSLAIQFLQCKQSNFVVHKFDSLPSEVQNQVSSFMTNKRKPEEKKPEMKSIKVPIPTFPPTAMVYSIPKSPKPDKKLETIESPPPVDIVSAAIMAKVLEERQKEKAYAKHCDTCTCSKKLQIIYEINCHTIGTQTGEYKNMLCLRCNDTLNTTTAAVRIVRNNESAVMVAAPAMTTTMTTKKVPIYANETVTATHEKSPTNTNGNNIVKVQPNNFLIEVSNNPIVNNHNINNSGQQTIEMVDETSQQKSKKSPQLIEHHHLCNKSIPGYEIEANTLRATATATATTTATTITTTVTVVKEQNSDKASAKNDSSDLKGPRYCSMRLQSGTKNILLDNAHNNVAPVLYTRHHHPQHNHNFHNKFNNNYNNFNNKDTPKLHEILQKSQTESCSSEDIKNNQSLASENSSVHNQQRVADWIKNNLDNDISHSDNSQSIGGSRDNLISEDRVKYAEMEENVKRFLFGESEFLKTVEIGKLKYRNYRETNGDEEEDKTSNNNINNNQNNKSNSHTETEI